MNIKMLWLPVALAFKWIGSLRKWLFQRGILNRYQPPLPTIVIGNISMGGTGKTPMSEYILKLLENINCGFLSRGYGRQSKGFQTIFAHSTAQQVGDEPLQIAQNFPEVKAAVCEKRPLGIQKLMQNHPKLEAIVLDDAYQHWPLKAHYYLLLTTFEKPFFKDFVFPVGFLRESRRAAAKAHCIVVTKCPTSMSSRQQEQYRRAISQYSNAPVYFSTLQNDNPTNSQGHGLRANAPVAAITAIANPVFWLRSIKRQYQVQNCHIFKDHHFFSLKDIRPLMDELQQQAELQAVCTEKDYVKLRPLIAGELLSRFYVQRVRHQFLEEDAQNFEASIHKLLRKE